MHSWSQITQIFFFKKGDIRHNKHTESESGSRRRNHTDQAAAADGGPRRGEVKRSHQVGGQDCRRRPSGVKAASSVRAGATIGWGRQQVVALAAGERTRRPPSLLPAQATWDPRANRRPCTPAGRRGPCAYFRFASGAAGGSHGSARWGREVRRRAEARGGEGI